MTLRLLGAALLASFSLSLGTGCIGGCDPVGSQQQAPIELHPSSVEAIRTPETCGAASPPFTDNDSFLLEVTGETNVPPPYNTLTLVVTRTVPLNQAFPLDVLAPGATQTAALDDPSITFTYSMGSTPAEIDESQPDAVVVTVTAMPTADGEPLSATLQLFFEDGSELDQSFTALLESAACAPPSPTAS